MHRGVVALAGRVRKGGGSTLLSEHRKVGPRPKPSWEFNLFCHLRSGKESLQQLYRKGSKTFCIAELNLEGFGLTGKGCCECTRIGKKANCSGEELGP